ncbi:S8 family peptidase [Anaerobacillus sp. MEB173]|uniref:S8 family peptidase n=1 Tax=Anaerobacillus sp. MEB173 TaxID=3383345 RepID=UPI003F917489
MLTSCQSLNESKIDIQHFTQGDITTIEEDNDCIQCERYIIIYKNHLDEGIIEEFNGIVINETENIKMVNAYLPANKVEQLLQHPNILSIEIDQVVEVQPDQINWGYNYIQNPQTFQYGLTGQGIKIAVIDTGISPHFDLKISGGKSFVQYTNSFTDDNGHGTHVAGIIAAQNNNIGITGVAPESNIYSLKTLNENGDGYLSDIIAAIDWAISHKMDIINLSLGLNRHSTALQIAVNNAYSNQILVVAAGGNEGNRSGTGDTVAFPARYESVIAVSAIDSNNNRGHFSATGEAIELCAPGVNVVSTYLDNEYVVMDGTSMAAPFVTGALAILKQGNPTLRIDEIRTVLRQSVLDLGAKGKDPWFGYGLLQIPTQILFNDIINHWAINEILDVFNKGWMMGTGEKRFSPDVNLTRAQAATVIVRALDLKKLTQNTDSQRFTDIENHWAREEIEIITDNNLMVGINPNTFSPNSAMTREQMAVIITRMLDLQRPNDITNPFTDVQKDHWAADSIVTAAHYQIFKGVSPTTFGGKVIINRAQMATIMSRISEQLTKTPS